MSKHQRGNREAKKPKRPPPLPGTVPGQPDTVAATRPDLPAAPKRK